MKLLLFVAPAIASFLIALALTPLARRLAWVVGAVDQPNARKVHSSATPRLGGLAVIVAFLVAGSLLAADVLTTLPPLPERVFEGMALGLLPVLLVSIWDDIRPLPSAPKFAAHLIGAAIATYSGIALNPTVHLWGREIVLGVLAIPISVLWIVGVTNAFNLIDGLDGLSAGLGLISALGLFGVFLLAGRNEMAAMALVLAGALLGFLPYNLYPASIFLGDSGATAIGFFLACLTLRGGATLSAGLAVLIPVVILGIPLADTVLSMLRRFLRRTVGERTGGVFEADRDHIHHRLLSLGINHARAVYLLYGIGVSLVGISYLSVLMSREAGALLLATLFCAGFIGISRLGYDEFALLRRGVILRVYDAPVLRRGLFAVFVDLALGALALYVTVGLKYDDWGLATSAGMLRGLLVIAPPVSLACFAGFKLYAGAWRHASVEDLLRASGAVTSAALLVGVGCHLALQAPPPVSLFVIYWMTHLLLINGSRFSFRVLQHWNLRGATEGIPVMIYGAGTSGVMALREVLANRAVQMKPVGFIDDDPQKVRKAVNGYPVLGPIEGLEDLIRLHDVKGIIIASGKIPEPNVAFARDVCERTGSKLLRFRMDFAAVQD